MGKDSFLVIGGGNMGSCYVSSLIANGTFNSEDVGVFDKDNEKLKKLNAEYGINTYDSFSSDLLAKYNVILIAVKPQDFAGLAIYFENYSGQNLTLISIMAGVNTSKIEEICGISSIVRAMPNTPAKYGKGISGYFVTEEELNNIAVKVLSATGEIVKVEKEDLLDAITAVSGSGPAYYYYIVDAMVKAGVSLGLDEDSATKLALKTIEGSIFLMENEGKTFEELISNVKSKGGTTEAALNVFADHDLDKTIKEALTAANDRAKELSK